MEECRQIKEDRYQEMQEKPNIKFRVPLLDMSFLFETRQLPRSREVGHFVCLQGTVIRTGLFMFRYTFLLKF